jgi:hypothetical protein
MSTAPVIASATERMVFSVESSSREGKRYRVDLLANRGGAWCSCKNHAFQAQLAIDQAMPLWTRHTTCRHVRKAARYFMINLIADMSKTENGF